MGQFRPQLRPIADHFARGQFGPQSAGAAVRVCVRIPPNLALDRSIEKIDLEQIELDTKLILCMPHKNQVDDCYPEDITQKPSEAAYSTKTPTYFIPS